MTDPGSGEPCRVARHLSCSSPHCRSWRSETLPGIGGTEGGFVPELHGSQRGLPARGRKERCEGPRLRQGQAGDDLQGQHDDLQPEQRSAQDRRQGVRPRSRQRWGRVREALTSASSVSAMPRCRYWTRHDAGRRSAVRRRQGAAPRATTLRSLSRRQPGRPRKRAEPPTR